MTVNPVWHRKQIDNYKKMQPVYEKYAEVLTKILGRACKIHSPEGIVQARAKSLSSFAEKAIRKANKYDNPVSQLTDLCGARVIVQSQEQVKKICEFIKENFDVDEKNSIDVSSRLKTIEFGYLSVHYIVSINSDNIFGIECPKEIRKLKAEIQVRTLLQHMWASSCHDRIYKSAFKVPVFWQRESARLAAQVENADIAFERMTSALDSYLSNYEKYMNTDELSSEINILTSILANEPDDRNKPAIALKLCRLYRNEGNWQKVISTIESLNTGAKSLNNELIIELGVAYCQLNKNNFKSRKYIKGQNYLELAAKKSQIQGKTNTEQNKITAKTLWLLSATLNISSDYLKARDLCYKAFQLDPQNPYYLISFIESELIVSKNTNFIHFLQPLILNAIESCNLHIQLGLEKPAAYFALSKLYAFVGQINLSIDYYLKGADFTLKNKIIAESEKIVHDLVVFEIISKKIPSLHLQTLISCIRIINDRIADKQSGKVKSATFKNLPVAIIAGSENKDSFIKNAVEEAINSYKGTLILRNTQFKNFKNLENQFSVYAYLPSGLLKKVKTKTDLEIKVITTSKESDFSASDSLTFFQNLISSDLNFAETKLLGLDANEVSIMQYKIALMLGARIGIIDNYSSALISDEYWSEHKNLIVLPNDRMTIKAFITIDKQGELKEQQIETIAKQVHANYILLKKKLSDSNMVPWEDLREDFKHSNKLQVRYMHEIYSAAGYKIRKAKNQQKIKFPKLSAAELEYMAEMEHGRWNIDRLFSSWHFGPVRNDERKTTPFIVPYEQLTDEIKEYDRDAVRNFPKLLAETGFEVYR